MGYKSDVVIAMNKKTVMKYGLLLNKLIKLNELADLVETTNEGNTYWYINDIKWYDDYPEIADITNLMNELDLDNANNNTDVAYAFMRIGEESGDVEDRGVCSEFDIYYTQSIYSPFSS